MCAIYLDKFGFLNVAREVAFSGGRITALPDFADTKQLVETWGNSDGFLYPPRSYSVDLTGQERPNSERPAFLYQVPASHELSLDCWGSDEAARLHCAGFVLHLLAYLYGTRLQFWDWWVDSRLPIKTLSDMSFTHGTTSTFLGHALGKWLHWPESIQRRFTNAMYLHCRSLCYEWDWEQFSVEYMVTDACYAIGLSLRHFGAAKGHADRIRTMCDAYGLHRDDETVRKFVDLRNDLIHESLWDNQCPGGFASGPAFMASRSLHRLNQRLIAAVLQVRNSYIATSWNTFGRHHFDAPE